MKFLPTYRLFGAEAESPLLVSGSLSDVDAEGADEESTLIKTVGWVSAALGAVALGLVLGRELRERYKFTRRTPYEVYSHSADDQEIDFGLGI